jgi:hypothetical protein
MNAVSILFPSRQILANLCSRHRPLGLRPECRCDIANSKYGKSRRIVAGPSWLRDRDCTDDVLPPRLVLVYRYLPKPKSAVRTQAEVWLLSIRARISRNLCAVLYVVFKSINAVLLSLIFPLHFLAMFCLFYLLYFVSKSLVLAETCKPASFNDYAGPFFLIWFFPIGIWFIQPRINRQYMESFAPVGGPDGHQLI